MDPFGDYIDAGDVSKNINNRDPSNINYSENYETRAGNTPSLVVASYAGQNQATLPTAKVPHIDSATPEGNAQTNKVIYKALVNSTSDASPAYVDQQHQPVQIAHQPHKMLQQTSIYVDQASLCQPTSSRISAPIVQDSSSKLFLTRPPPIVVISDAEQKEPHVVVEADTQLLVRKSTTCSTESMNQASKEQSTSKSLVNSKVLSPRNRNAKRQIGDVMDVGEQQEVDRKRSVERKQQDKKSEDDKAVVSTAALATRSKEKMLEIAKAQILKVILTFFI